MSVFGQMPDHIRIPIFTDEDGMLGRECPAQECLGYFKIKLGTGLKGENLPCHCPYCGHTGSQNTFWTQEQIEYAKSIALRKLQGVVIQELKKMEFNHPPRGPFGIGISMKVEEGPKPPVRYYREKVLETRVICDHCGLDYAIYGLFAYCPDCRQHNSYQTLAKNFELIVKMLELARSAVPEVSRMLIENALEDSVSAFDGFGRALCRVHASRASDQKRAAAMSFQNLEGARKNLKEVFSIDLASLVQVAEWSLASRCFQKRHLLAHTMGVIDDDYVRKSGDAEAVRGRKVVIMEAEARELLSVLITMAKKMADTLNSR